VGIVGTGRKARVIAVMEVLLRENAEKGVLLSREQGILRTVRGLYARHRRRGRTRIGGGLAFGAGSSAGTEGGSTSGPMPPGSLTPGGQSLAGLHPTHSIFPSSPPLQGFPFETFSDDHGLCRGKDPLRTLRIR